MSRDENEQKFAELFWDYGCDRKIYIADGDTTEWSDEIDINYSTILTKLIQEAGRYCEHYASDLFISWNLIEQSLRDGTIESGVEMFGFREMGVDHLGFIYSRAWNDYRNFEKEYRSIWKLDITVDVDDEYWWHKEKKFVHMILHRVSSMPDYRYEDFFRGLKEAKDGISVSNKESVES